MSITIQDVREAYLQYKRQAYYERLDLNARQRIVEFETQYNLDLEARFQDIFSWVNFSGFGLTESGVVINEQISVLIESIDVNVFVKKVKNTEDENTSNFITDAITNSGFKLTRENVFISIPVELQILGTLWLRSVGKTIDRDLSEYCYGNRLLHPRESDLNFNGRLYKIYHFQYAKWWKKGLAKAKSILREDNNDVVMINFDLKSYYHKICLDFDKLRGKIDFDNLDYSDRILHHIVESVITKYNERILSLGLNKNVNKFSLPIGYIVSPVLANYYLDKFDKDVIQNIRPSYYGRYVDDIFVVFKSGTPKEKEAREEDKSNYIELESLKGEFQQSKEAIYRFLKYLGSKVKLNVPNSESEREDGINFELAGVEGIELQLEKLFVYELDKTSPSNLIENFIQEQREKSSEFRFESEENDGVPSDFGDILFDQSFDKDDASQARIKKLTQNRFEVSVFLSRLIRRATKSESSPYHKQLKNIVSYYRGANCIENWWIWEKICLALVSNNENELFIKFVKSAYDSIYKLDYDLELDANEIDNVIDRVKKSMKFILKISIANAIAGNPRFLELDGIEKILGIRELDTIDFNQIRNTGFIRNEFTAFPLIGLLEQGIKSKVSYYSRNQITELFVQSSMHIKNFFLDYSPVRVKYWQICHIYWLNALWSLKTVSSASINRTFIDSSLEMDKILLPAFVEYHRINYLHNGNPHELRRKYFFRIAESLEREAIQSNKYSEPEKYGLAKKELNVIASEVKPKLRFGLVNEDVQQENYRDSAKGNPIDYHRIENSMQILDELQRKKCDLGIQPELSVPHSFIWDYCSYSDRHQIGLIAGIEHMRVKDVVFNFIMTVLPIKINGIYNDAIPVIRLKNHYAPKEEVMVNYFRATVPKPIRYEYHLYNWRGLYFTNYYCYELADINHRTLFQGEIDVLVAPVWNPDTNYYNGIVETSAREIHCIFSQVNTAKYGDTRWTLPAKTELKNPLTVKGGTTEDNPFTISLSDYHPKYLREFQNLDYQGQDKDKSFKPTPPDFPKDKVVKRLTNQFFYDDEK